MARHLLVPALAAAVALAPAGRAAAGPPGLEAVATAKGLMLTGRPDQARSLLEQLDRTYRDNNDVDFLLGLLAIEASAYDEAIRRFRSILVRDPDAIRVRLELARAFFLKRDYENAFRQFQFARAGELPPGVAATIERFVAAIRRQKNWSYHLDLALAPDTNINNGTTSTETVLFGLPFQLGDELRQKSGTGLAMGAGAEFAPRIGETARLRLGAAFQRRDYKGERFDDMTVAVHAGPRLNLGRWDLSLLATGFRRWFGGSRLSDGAGARLEATHYAGARTLVSLGIAAQHIRYPDHPAHTGQAYSLSGGVVRALSPSSSVTARAGLIRKTARDPDLASWSRSIAVGYARDLPGGFSFYVEPGFADARYDAPDPFFGERRRDKLYELRIAALNRRIVLDRFTPRVALTIARRSSTIDLHDYSQRRLEVGLTSAF